MDVQWHRFAHSVNISLIEYYDKVSHLFHRSRISLFSGVSIIPAFVRVSYDTTVHGLGSQTQPGAAVANAPLGATTSIPFLPCDASCTGGADQFCTGDLLFSARRQTKAPGIK